MQIAVERAEAESDRSATEEKIACLRHLPGFTNRSQHDIMRILLDHPITVKMAMPKQTLFTAGMRMNHVRSLTFLQPLHLLDGI